MSYTVVSEITKAIQKLLQKKMRNKVPISLLPPEDDKFDENKLNIYLYRVVENPFFKNRDWPGNRVSHGLPYPSLALNLFYLLTPYATKEEYDTTLPHQILSDAMQIFHENPIINDTHDSDFDADTELSADLRNSFEKIKITLVPISIDEMSKIWSSFNKPYRLSVVYETSLVQIAPMIRPIVVTPVMEARVEIIIPSPPFISEASPQSGPAGSIIKLLGGNFCWKGTETVVKVSGAAVIPKKIEDDEIIFELPRTLPRGPEVDILVTVGSESASAKFIVSPWIDRILPIRGPVDPTNPNFLKAIIRGTGFKGSVDVLVDGIKAKLIPKTETEIEVYMPSGLSNGIKNVSIISNGFSSNNVDFEIVPLLKSLSPKSGGMGQPVYVTGERLDGRAAIYIGSTTVGLDKNPSSTGLTFRVPSLSPGDYELLAVIEGHVSNPLSFRVTI